MDITVIIPTYNRLWSLPSAVDTCKSSKCQVEIIVVDDGSTDGSWDWLSSQNDIIAIKQNNWGKCWAVNRAFSMATGKYVRFLDSDDMLDQEANFEQFALAEKENADIVVSGYKVINDRAQILREQKWISCDDFIAQQLGECDSSHYSSYLFRKDFIQDIPHRPDFAFRDDRLLVIEAAIKGPKVVVHEGTALLHRTHQNTRLQFNNGMQQTVQNFQHFNLYKKMLNLLKIRGELTERRIRASVPMLWALCHWIAKHNINDAANVLTFIREIDPQFEIPEKGFSAALYKRLGFRTTEKILTVRRIFKYGFQ